MQKPLKDFTIEEAVDRALGAFGAKETQGRAEFEDERNALRTVVEFKVAENQDKINRQLLQLTKWLVILSIALVMLTLMLAFPMIVEIISRVTKNR